jgi:hypothetical protein
MANHMGTRWRGKLPIPADATPLVRELFRSMNRQRATIGEIGARSGITYQAISEWRYRRKPSLENFIAAANALGLDVKLVARRD